jgi:hypothetical protein
MKAIGWFLGGMVVGTVLVQASVAQDRARRGLNHIGIGTKNYESALAFYRDTLGAKEAFTIHNPDGTVRITYRDRRPRRERGELRERGITVADPTVGISKARVARITDVDGVNIEVMQMGPDSMQRQAIEAWR